MSRPSKLRSRLSLQSLEVRDVPSTTLLKDINAPAFFNSYPEGGAVLSDKYYFSAVDQDHGRELWRTDGTPQGTELVADINPGSASSGPDNFAAFLGKLYFAADGGAGDGYELWVYDGSLSGPHQVKDINPGANPSSPSDFTAINNTLYFAAYSGASGGEVWKTDGTSGGTVMVKDINDNPNGGKPGQLTNFNGTLYFSARNSASGGELWKSDGTAAGTVLVKDINPGANDSTPTDLTVMNGKLYFAASDATSGRELWVSDGSAAGTMQVRDINIGANDSSPSELTAINNVLFFRAQTSSNGNELWRSDGSAFGTVSVKDIKPGAASALPMHLSNIGGTLFFSADDGTTGVELWKSDGSTAGTVLVKDLRPGANGFSPNEFTNVNGTLYFFGNGINNGLPNQVWKSDGTSNGTMLVKDFGIGSIYVLPIGTIAGTLFLNAQGSATQGHEIWMTTSVRRIDKMVIGADAGQLPQVRVYNTSNQAVEMNLFAYAPTFTGGVRVAVGDVTGDGVDDIITAPGATGGPHIRVFDGVTGICKKEFFAYAPNFAGGVFIASGDLNNDGYADIITGAGAGGGPHVKVFSGKNLSLITEFFAFAPTFLGGVNVGAGDVNADGYSDLIFAAGPGGGPHVRVVSGKDNKTELRSFFAFDAAFTGGVNVAAGDLNGDGYEDLIVAQATNGERIHTYNGRDNVLLNDFNAIGGNYTGGVRVAAADYNHDGRAELFSAVKLQDHVVVLSRYAGSPNTFVGGLSIYDPAFLGGVFVGG